MRSNVGILRMILIGTVLAPIPVPRAGAQDILARCRELVLRVRDVNGPAIPNALITVDGTLVLTTDFHGTATIPCDWSQSAVRVVEVAAPGYRRKVVSVPAFAFGETDIRMERTGSTALQPRATVSVEELSPDVQRRSQRLQEQAVQALESGDHIVAERLLREALVLTPSSVSIYNNLGVASLRRQNSEEAAFWFEKAVRMSPYSPQILGNLGLARWMQNRLEESYELLHRATAGGFSTCVAHYILGVMSLQKAQYEDAVHHLRKTEERHHRYRNLYLATAERARGNVKAARKSFRTFLRGRPAALSMAVIPRRLESH